MFFPATELRLLNVPLRKNSGHQLDFSNREEQTNYFINSTPNSPTFTNVNYQRNVGGVDIKGNVNDFFGYNYMMWQNKNFTDKWFYAFIDSVNYMSEIVTNIAFTIDSWQSFQFDVSLKDSFVEREHVQDDSLYKHTVPEGLETGEFITTNEVKLAYPAIAVWGCFTEKIEGVEYDDITVASGLPLGGLAFKYFGLTTDDSTATAVANTILQYSNTPGKEEAIISFFTSYTNQPARSQQLGEAIICRNELPITPKNNKLYSSPYSNLVLSSLNEAHILNWEKTTPETSVELRSSFGVNSTISATITNYGGDDFPIEYTVSLSSFPILPWKNNQFEQYIASSKVSRTISIVTGLMSIAGGSAISLLSGGLGSIIGIGAIGSGVKMISDNLSQVYNASIIPDSFQGASNAIDTISLSFDNALKVRCKTVREEYAQIIDEFFSTYGYKVNVIKTPQYTSRLNWNYLKTVDINITGAVNENYLSEIREMFNNGVTMWHNPNTMYDYDQSNIII